MPTQEEVEKKFPDWRWVKQIRYPLLPMAERLFKRPRTSGALVRVDTEPKFTAVPSVPGDFITWRNR